MEVLSAFNINFPCINDSNFFFSLTLTHDTWMCYLTWVSSKRTSFQHRFMLNLRIYYNLLSGKDYAAIGLWYEQMNGCTIFFNIFQISILFTLRSNLNLNQHRISDMNKMWSMCQTILVFYIYIYIKCGHHLTVVTRGKVL